MLLNMRLLLILTVLALFFLTAYGRGGRGGGGRGGGGRGGGRGRGSSTGRGRVTYSSSGRGRGYGSSGSGTHVSNSDSSEDKYASGSSDDTFYGVGGIAYGAAGSNKNNGNDDISPANSYTSRQRVYTTRRPSIDLSYLYTRTPFEIPKTFGPFIGGNSRWTTENPVLALAKCYQEVQESMNNIDIVAMARNEHTFRNADDKCRRLLKRSVEP